MKLRYLFLLAIGIVIGVRIASKMREDDPNVVTGPQRDQYANGNQAAKIVSTQAQRLADQATGLSLDAIRRARGAIRIRLGDNVDDSTWN